MSILFEHSIKQYLRFKKAPNCMNICLSIIISHIWALTLLETKYLLGFF